MMENAFRQSLIMSAGGFGIFIYRPISMVLLLVTAIILLLPFIPGLRRIPKEKSQ